MGREIRMVPPDWQHPKNAKRSYIPLMKGPFSKALAEWDEENERWAKGEVLDYSTWPKQRTFKPKEKSALECESYAEWAGERPVQGDYMPEFEPGTATMLMMYEDTSEGTPISPAFATPEELARWLADNNASAFGGMTATYEQWLATCNVSLWLVGRHGNGSSSGRQRPDDVRRRSLGDVAVSSTGECTDETNANSK